MGQRSIIGTNWTRGNYDSTDLTILAHKINAKVTNVIFGEERRGNQDTFRKGLYPSIQYRFCSGLDLCHTNLQRDRSNS